VTEFFTGGESCWSPVENENPGTVCFTLVLWKEGIKRGEMGGINFGK